MWYQHGSVEVRVDANTGHELNRNVIKPGQQREIRRLRSSPTPIIHTVHSPEHIDKAEPDSSIFMPTALCPIVHI